jgi:hypothetical protein
MSTSANTVIEQLFVFAPQFYTTDSDRLAYLNTLYIFLTTQVNVQFLGCAATSVFAFLMAHYLTLAANPNLGIYNNIHEGELSLGFNVNPEITSLNLTPYGKSYLDLVGRTSIGSTVTNLPVVFGGVIQGMPIGWGCNGGGPYFGGGSGGCGCGC